MMNDAITDVNGRGLLIVVNKIQFSNSAFLPSVPCAALGPAKNEAGQGHSLACNGLKMGSLKGDHWPLGVRRGAYDTGAKRMTKVVVQA